MDASARGGGAYYAAAVLAAFGLLARALGWGALGAVSVASWIAIQVADRSLGRWVAPRGVPGSPARWGPLPRRTIRILDRAGVTPARLPGMTDRQLLRIRGVGPRAARDPRGVPGAARPGAPAPVRHWARE